ncbi:MAG: hypothetical protein IPJ13_18335 [Saprospiraceae bacterium]|nr:hypothetical protein [Saprospiraceae bacterium]
MKNKYFFVVFFLTFVSCSRQYHLADISTRTYRIEKASFPVDVTAAALIEPYKLQLDKTMNDVISINEEELVKRKTIFHIDQLVLQIFCWMKHKIITMV